MRIPFRGTQFQENMARNPFYPCFLEICTSKRYSRTQCLFKKIAVMNGWTLLNLLSPCSAVNNDDVYRLPILFFRTIKFGVLHCSVNITNEKLFPIQEITLTVSDTILTPFSMFHWTCHV